jgi:predicted ferric reductase
MPPRPAVENEFDESSITVESFLLIFLAILTGLLAAILLLPAWLPNLATSLMGESPKVYWYLSRATAFVSLTVLWLSMALGIGITNKMARLWPGAPAAFAIHEYVSILGMAFALFHALVLLGDHYINFTVSQIFMPFATASYRPTWVGIGQISFYVWLIVNVSFYVRKLIGQKTWRVLHYLSFGMYIMGLVHGLFSGTDSPASWAQWYYWISGGSLLFLFVYRLLNTITEKSARPAPRPVPQPQRLPPQPKPVAQPVPQQVAVSQPKPIGFQQPVTQPVAQMQSATSHPPQQRQEQ